MQQATIGLVGWMINEPDMDHVAALEWTRKIDSSEASKAFYFEHIARDWLHHDPSAGREALASMELPEETKTRLLNRSTKPEVDTPSHIRVMGR